MEMQKSWNTVPCEGFFTDMYTKFPKLFGKVVVIFDALDECEQGELATISDFIEKVQ